MLQKAEAIVLRTTRLGDDKMIADLYTRAFGRMACVVKNGKGRASRSRKQLFQPLTMLSVEVDYRQRMQTQHLRDVQILHPWVSLPFDIRKSAIALFLAEVLTHALRQEQTDDLMFDFLCNSLQWFDLYEGQTANFHIAFLIQLSRHLGIQPSTDNYADGRVFDIHAATFSDHIPLSGAFLEHREAAAASRLLRMTYANMHRFAFSRNERQRILSVILAFYQTHIPSFPKLKSPEVLHELFG